MAERYRDGGRKAEPGLLESDRLGSRRGRACEQIARKPVRTQAAMVSDQRGANDDPVHGISASGSARSNKRWLC